MPCLIEIRYLGRSLGIKGGLLESVGVGGMGKIFEIDTSFLSCTHFLLLSRKHKLIFLIFEEVSECRKVKGHLD